jgi:hypothetical protein
MAIMTVLIVGLLVYFIGRHLVRMLGWPRSLEDGAKWSAILFAIAVAAMGLPRLVSGIDSVVGRLPPIDAGELIAVLLVVGLGVLGYVAWRKGEERVQHEPRFLPRKRALPPPPNGGQQGDDHFAVIDPLDDD